MLITLTSPERRSDNFNIIRDGTNDLPDDVKGLRAALIAERAARRESEARASGPKRW